MALTIAHIERLYRSWDVTAMLRDGTAAALTGVDIAVLPPRTTPTAATTWTATTYAAGVATVLLAGPDADPTGAVVIPATGADVWLRVVDTPEVDTHMVERITVA